MTSGWRDTTIGNEITLQRGFDITRAQQRPGDVPVVSSSGISSLHDTAMVEGPGVVLGRKGVVGSVYYIDSNFWPHDTTLWVKDFKGNLPRFVYYFFQGMVDRITGMDVGSANPTLNRNHVHPIEVRWPPLSQQRAIAGVLGTLDDKINQNRRTVQALEQLAQVIFRAWFVNFDPVKAKAAGETAFPSMPQSVFDALPIRLVDSEIGPLPEGWEVGTVADLGEVICGKTPPTNKPENYGNDVCFITIPDMHGKVFVTDTGKKLSFTGANSQKQKYLPANSICVSCIATPGLVVITSDRAQTNQQINSIIPREDLSPYYCYETLSRLGVQIRAGGSGGSVFHNLNKSRFSTLKILLPPKEVVSLFHGTVAPLFEKILANQKESHKLAELRDLLLPKLLSGQVRVAVDADRSEVST